VGHHEKCKGRKSLDAESYVIQDFLQGLSVTRIVNTSSAHPHFRQQLAILKAAGRRFESSLFEIRQLIQADLFDSEIDAARELVRSGFLRPAGALAGVILEKHLLQVCEDHTVKGTKKNPTIGDLNELLSARAT
jgi:hypothetical protein